MKAIIYSSNTGFTKQYAEMLAEKTGLTAYSLSDAEKHLNQSDKVIYMSWLMAGQVTDYKKALKMFEIPVVCAVGLCKTGTQLEETRKANKIPDSVELFTIQGGYAPYKLKGIYKFLMKIVTKVLIKKIDKMESPDESDLQMRDVLKNGGSLVSDENLKDVLEFINK